ncbi:MAG: cupin domain-containing protein [Rhodobiaceae bacterium]
MTNAFHIPLDAARARIPPGPDDPQFVILRERGSLTVELYRPLEIDRQQPHSRDECYVVVEGNGIFEMGDETVTFGPGDFLFVPAGVPHRFRDFGESMMTWVMFYGPEGGEDA